MNAAHHINVGEVYVSQTGTELGDIAGLYEHQLRTIQSEANVILLDAPTGSGKTLAALARVLRNRTPAIFIYPTNSLVKDQLRSIKDLLVKLGYHPNIIDEDWNAAQEEPISDNTIYIVHATGETLEVLAEGGAKGTALERILKRTDTGEGMRIVLTNPDTLYLVSTGMYHRSGLISEQIFKFSSIVIDEFHLYAGPTLARLFFMLNELRADPKRPSVELLFLSATHGDTMQLLQDSYPDSETIKVETLPNDGSDRRRIRCQTHGAIVSQSAVLTDEDDARQIAEEILKLYDSSYDWDGQRANVKVLAIFSSVTFAVTLTQVLKELIRKRGDDPDRIVYQIHGLIPRKARPTIENLSEAILIGTAAIEVGVDFNVPLLVMEAHDLASFLQRFGRGGRHNSCEFRLYVPQPMADRLQVKNDWPFAEFIAEAEAAFHELFSYADFICSKQAKYILLAMALAGTRTYDYYRRRDSYDIKKARDYFKHLIESNRNVRIHGKDLVDEIGQLDDDEIEIGLQRFPVEVLAEYSFARGAMNSILVRFPKRLIGVGTGSLISELDIFDVFRVRGALVTADQIWDDIPSELQRRYTRKSPVFLVDDFEKRQWPRVALAPDALARWTSSVFVSDQITIKAGGPALTQAINDLLHRRNLVFFWKGMNRMTDYRIPRLYVENENGAVVIGDWALVAEFLAKQQRREDERI